MKITIVTAPTLGGYSSATGPEPLKTTTILRSFALPEAFHLTMDAVYCESGRQPSHFLVGWKTWLEMRVDRDTSESFRRPRWVDYPSVNGEPTFHGVPIRLDPTRGHYVLAVPEFEWLVGRDLPKGAKWEPVET